MQERELIAGSIMNCMHLHAKSSLTASSAISIINCMYSSRNCMYSSRKEQSQGSKCRLYHQWHVLFTRAFTLYAKSNLTVDNNLTVDSASITKYLPFCRVLPIVVGLAHVAQNTQPHSKASVAHVAQNT